MTTASGAGAPVEDPRPAPTPRRVRRARWMDPRVIGGVLLVVVAVVLGARVVGAGSVTHPVWVADRRWRSVPCWRRVTSARWR